MFFFVLGGSFVDLILHDPSNSKIPKLFNNQKFIISYTSGWLREFLFLAFLLALIIINFSISTIAGPNLYFYKFISGAVFLGSIEYILPFKKWVVLEKNSIVLGSGKIFPEKIKTFQINSIESIENIKFGIISNTKIKLKSGEYIYIYLNKKFTKQLHEKIEKINK